MRFALFFQKRRRIPETQIKPFREGTRYCCPFVTEKRGSTKTKEEKRSTETSPRASANHSAYCVSSTYNVQSETNVAPTVLHERDRSNPNSPKAIRVECLATTNRPDHSLTASFSAGKKSSRSEAFPTLTRSIDSIEREKLCAR